jgi:LuxR family maltose regulon positive regulatory protein
MADRHRSRDTPARHSLAVLRRSPDSVKPTHPPGQGISAQQQLGRGAMPMDPAPLPAPAPSVVDLHPISRAKVTPAPVRETTLARDRLLDWLHDHIHRRLITVVAETGYGKTTLLADFARRSSLRCLWYKLDPSDRDWITFANYLVAAGREFDRTFGDGTLTLLHEMATAAPSQELIVSTLLAEMDALGDQSTVVIFDDYQLVDDEPQIRSIVTRLLAAAPDRMSFVLLARRRPRLALGRLAAQGEAAELTTDDLRFSADETERLFRDIYHQPLDADLLAQVEARTEGWAASLQMLHSTMKGRTAAEIRSFVRALTGAQGEFYDYLAEEVMDELDLDLQRFLTLTSILDTVAPELVAAIYATEQGQGDAETIRRWTAEAYQVGLMGRRSPLSTSPRYHPLMREFLQRRLTQLVTPEDLRAMHIRVARAAESTDWLASCRHYVRGFCEREAIRVLSTNATLALGSGQWGDAAGLVRDLGASEDDPRIAVILAREEVYQGHPDAALRRLEQFDLATLDGPDRGLVVQARVHAMAWVGLMDQVEGLVSEIVADPSVPEELRDIARATLASVGTTTTGSLADAERVLAEVAMGQERSNRPFHAGISWYNLMLTRLCAGRSHEAAEAGSRAIELFRRLPGTTDEVYSSHTGLARCHLELGDLAVALDHIGFATSGATMGSAEQWVQCAPLLVILGQRERAAELLNKAEATSLWPSRLFVAMRWHADTRMLLSGGHFEEALQLLGSSSEAWPAVTPGAWLSWMELRTSAALVTRRIDEARGFCAAGARLAELQGSGMYRGRFVLLRALCGADGPTMADAFGAASGMDLLSDAEAIVRRLDVLVPLPSRLAQSIESVPDRWLPLLRQAIRSPEDPCAKPAAVLLDRFGELEDVRPLRALTRSATRGFRGSNVGLALAQRRSPKLHVADLGRTAIEIGSRRVELSQMRRKSASVLCFLLTRQGLVATKEQILDAIWPDLDPNAALNSLNQTLYFLRRDIDPAYDDDVSAQYVRFEGDLLWLDHSLSDCQSRLFYEASSNALAGEGFDIEQGSSALKLYQGRFSPEFEYEDWAMAWRDMLNARYLHLAEKLGAHLIRVGRLSGAADVALHVLSVNPDAEDMERELIWLYGALGTRSAAAEQYAHYAAVQRSDYGIEPPTLDEILTGH